MQPFMYPESAHVRVHGPIGYSTTDGFRPWLRDEFSFLCVYCLRMEQWGRNVAEFAIDHFLPTSAYPDRALEYDNLLYACESCNTRKGDQLVPDPLSVLLESAITVNSDGTIVTKTTDARKLVRSMQLDSRDAVKFRARWIRVFQIAARFDPALLAELLAPPDDLPDLAALRPPGGNSRPDGAARSHFARRVRP